MLNFRSLRALAIVTIATISTLSSLGCGDDKVECYSEAVDPAKNIHRCVCEEDGDVTSRVLFEAGNMSSMQAVDTDCYVDGTPATTSDGDGCTVTEIPGGALIECDDGTSATVNNGTDGSNGANGVDGTSCTVAEVTGGVLIECPDGTSVFIPTGGGGSDPPPPPVGGWELCWLTPNADLLLHTPWYQQQASYYRVASYGDLSCIALGSYAESYPANTAGTWLIVNHAQQCVGTVNILAGSGLRVLGGAASGSDTAEFDQYNDVSVGFAELGGCAVAAMTQGGFSVWISSAPSQSNLTSNEAAVALQVWGGSSSLDDQICPEIDYVISEPPASFK